MKGLKKKEWKMKSLIRKTAVMFMFSLKFSKKCSAWVSISLDTFESRYDVEQNLMNHRRKL